MRSLTATGVTATAATALTLSLPANQATNLKLLAVGVSDADVGREVDYYLNRAAAATTIFTNDDVSWGDGVAPVWSFTESPNGTIAVKLARGGSSNFSGRIEVVLEGEGTLVYSSGGAIIADAEESDAGAGGGVTTTPGSSISVFADYGVTGLVLGLTMYSELGAVVVARSTTGITEVGGSIRPGLYRKTVTAPVTLGNYLLEWDSGGGTPIYAHEDLLVVPPGSGGGGGGGGGGGTAAVDLRRVMPGPVSFPTPGPRRLVDMDDVDPTLAANGTVPVWTDGLHVYQALTGGGGGGDPVMGGDLSGLASNAQLAAGVVGSPELGASSVTATKIATGAVITAKIAAGAVTTTELGDGSVSAAKLFGTAAERAMVLGKAGVIPNSVTDGADFLIVVPFDSQLRRAWASLGTAPPSAVTVTLRRSVNGGSTFTSVAGYAPVIAAGARVSPVIDPADVNVNQGDVLNFSSSGGGGTVPANLLLEAVLVPR